MMQTVQGKLVLGFCSACIVMNVVGCSGGAEVREGDDMVEAESAALWSDAACEKALNAAQKQNLYCLDNAEGWFAYQQKARALAKEKCAIYLGACLSKASGGSVSGCEVSFEICVKVQADGAAKDKQKFEAKHNVCNGSYEKQLGKMQCTN